MDHDRSVCCIDESAAQRRHVTKMAASMGVKTAAYRSAEEYLAASTESNGGCLVLNARLPGISGLELLVVMEDWSSRPAVVLTIRPGDVSTAVRAMSLGAVTALPIPCRRVELHDAFDQAMEAAKSRREHDSRLRRIESGLAALTAEEREVLGRIVEGQMNKGIAHSLGAGLRTVEMRRHSIMAKLGARSLAELVRFVCVAQRPDRLLTRSLAVKVSTP